MASKLSSAVSFEASRRQPNHGQLDESFFRAATLPPEDLTTIDQASVTILVPLRSRPEPFVIAQMKGDSQ
ncbi:hypothetical protein [Mesorhizobium sp.]|uniref:hypothetical protein n=1 Tax=Mesorhizobium sp. TaxID=1871066 RepID=UPI000FE9FDA7|nr:hypothetical protein [Mesorhizobium sp.]RWD43448.1 MAG: hypothetical protein EOS35_20795 [Mesorhizobium sp.]